jgi:hypothetical protein
MLTPDDPRHGTNNGYGNHGCRCDPCRTANNAYQRATYERLREKRGIRPHAEYVAQMRETLVHGNETGYNRGCRCELCKPAGAAGRRRRRHADLEKANAYDREYKRRRAAAR